MNTTVKCESSVSAERDEYLTAQDVSDWLKTIPSDAHIFAITREIGSQRDPYTHTVGLRATWQESR